jgi:hypothetical protein
MTKSVSDLQAAGVQATLGPAKSQREFMQISSKADLSSAT